MKDRAEDQVAKVPPSSGLYLLLAQIEIRTQEPAKAETALQKAIDIDKNNVPAFMLLSSLQVSQGKARSGNRKLQKALGGESPRASSLCRSRGRARNSRTNGKRRRPTITKPSIFSPIIRWRRTIWHI